MSAREPEKVFVLIVQQATGALQDVSLIRDTTEGRNTLKQAWLFHAAYYEKDDEKARCAAAFDTWASGLPASARGDADPVQTASRKDGVVIRVLYRDLA